MTAITKYNCDVCGSECVQKYHFKLKRKHGGQLVTVEFHSTHGDHVCLKCIRSIFDSLSKEDKKKKDFKL